MTQDELIAAAKLKAAQHGLDPALVCAICEQESGWNTWANRYEPGFEVHPRYGPEVRRQAGAFRTLPQCVTSLETEVKNRCTSWGLMQVMGQVAREQGYVRPIPELCSPWEGLEVGCQILRMKLTKAGGDVRKALLAWNGGANPLYDDEVLARIGRY